MLYCKKGSRNGMEHSIINETVNTLRTIYSESSPLARLRRDLKNTLVVDLMRVKEGSDIELDALMSLVPEMAFTTVCIGSTCLNSAGQMLTVLNLLDDDKNLDYSTHVNCLYYDPAKPERQEVVREALTEIRPTVELDTLEADSIFKASQVFSDPNICRIVMEAAFAVDDKFVIGEVDQSPVRL